MRLGALPVIRLIRTLHVKFLHSALRRWAGHKLGDYSDGCMRVSTHASLCPVESVLLPGPLTL